MHSHLQVIHFLLLILANIMSTNNLDVVYS